MTFQQRCPKCGRRVVAVPTAKGQEVLVDHDSYKDGDTVFKQYRHKLHACPKTTG